MDDFARQLRLAQGGCADTVTSSGPMSTLDRPAGGAGTATYSYSTSSASSMTDVSPRSFSHYAGSSSSMSSVGSSSVFIASPTAFTLPRATLDDPAAVAQQQQQQHASKTTSVGSSTPIYTPAQRLENVYSLPKEIAIEETLLPPQNFAMVSSFVYRSSFPTRKNFPFLRSLGLKSVLTLILEEYPEPNLEFLEAEGIKFFQFGIPGNKEPFVQIPDEKIVAALSVIFDVRNHPILIHCNKGKHRTGCLVGCLRKAQQWSTAAIFDEYRRYSFPKSRSIDQQYIEAFDGLPEVRPSLPQPLAIPDAAH
ncbi:hypothetical protein RQP46_002052 [Phenoliferia psychrophenolica]